ncbi:MAG: hypothetical protein JWO71_1567 [Candidatus Acidoferrum typicum]|nr:hypothetical protein [Candidatus Acidoferrum typicum]
MRSDPRELSDLISVGPAMLRDFEILGVCSVSQLARRNPERLYESLCRVAPQHQDICCLDVFRAAVAQAKDPHLSADQCQWWYWSRNRKRLDKTVQNAGGKR